eukprot:COSAG02_NODE_8801_length_2439_cov_1.840171_3_plen_78_part_00
MKTRESGTLRATERDYEPASDCHALMSRFPAGIFLCTTITFSQIHGVPSSSSLTRGDTAGHTYLPSRYPAILKTRRP